MKIELLTKYDSKTADRVRELLIQLSRSGKDRGPIPQEWFNEIINSPYHDMIIAIDNDTIVGIATLSIIMGPIVKKIAYLEDFVTDQTYRGKGVGSAIWEAILSWSKEKGCTELNFTSGQGREAARAFYQRRGAKIYGTNFFRKTIVLS